MTTKVERRVGRPPLKSVSDAQRQAFDSVKHLRLLKAARNLTTQWRRRQDGSFFIPPGAVISLLHAVDESWDVVKGVSE